jgi:hypothetical protein
MRIAYADPPYVGCALMLEGDEGQHCEKCNFMCNSFPDREAAN